MPDKELRSHFDSLGNSHLAWTVSADNLLAAASILKLSRDAFFSNAAASTPSVGDPVPRDGRVLFPELMLRAFAVENLLKALWVKRGNKLAENGKYLKVPNANQHDLRQLADAVGLKFTGLERDVLRRLAVIMISCGRYPIPSDWHKRQIQPSFGGGRSTPEHWSASRDDDAFARIVVTIEDELAKFS